MKVKVITEKWALEEVEGIKKITGSYKVLCGATEVANQSFNSGYGTTTIIFPAELVVEIEKIGKKIESAITENFTGKETE